MSSSLYEKLINKNNEQNVHKAINEEDIKKIIAHKKLLPYQKLAIINHMLSKKKSEEKMEKVVNEVKAGDKVDMEMQTDPLRSYKKFIPNTISSPTKNILKDQSTEDLNGNTPANNVALDESIYSSNGDNSIISVNDSFASAEMDDSELDLSQEQKSLLANLKEAQGGTEKDVRDFSFEHLSNPDVSYINARDKLTGFTYQLNKPTKYRKYLDKDREKKGITRVNSPAHLRSKSKNSMQKRTETFNSGWKNYKQIRLSNYFGKKK